MTLATAFYSTFAATVTMYYLTFSIHCFFAKYNFQNSLWKLLCVLGLVILSNTSRAQGIFPPSSYPKKVTVRAEQINENIIIDGHLSEAAWTKAEAASNFIQSSPNQGKKSAYETQVKVLYDDHYIYFGALCNNPGGKIQVQDLRRDFIYNNNDLFGVFIDPFQDVQSPVQSFLVTPLSTQRDLLIYDDRIYDLNWDAVWTAKCSITDSTWTVEIAIPWSTLRYPSDSTTWSINFNRNIRSLNQITGWSPWPLAYTVGRMAYAGLVTNLHPPKNKANIRLEPYALADASKSNEDAKFKNKPQIGGELKWLINTNTSLEGTVNTDFAQADVDKQVINLKRSSVFFPERRQFFLENANLFSVGQDGIIQPFFSRRIGLSDQGSPLKIDEGARLLHQDAKQAYGALLIRQTDRDSSSSTWFGVLRAQRNLSTKARIGGLMTYRYDEQHHLANTVFALDGFLHISQPLYVRPMISVMLPSNGGKSGLAYFTELGYVKNTVSFSLYETYSSKNYDPKTGFQERTNFINTQPYLLFTLPVNWFNHKVRYFSPNIQADVYHNATTYEWQEANLYVTPVQLIAPNGSNISLSLQQSAQNLKSAYEIVPGITVPSGIFKYSRFDVSLSTNPSVPYSITADFNTGKFYNGLLQSLTFELRTVPIPNIAAGISSTYNTFSNFNHASTVHTTLLAPDLRISFTPKIQLMGFYQYNTVTNQGGLNTRFSWEYKPLSFIYIVYNDLKSINTTGLANAFREQAAIFKISYIRQL